MWAIEKGACNAKEQTRVLGLSEQLFHGVVLPALVLDAKLLPCQLSSWIHAE